MDVKDEDASLRSSGAQREVELRGRAVVRLVEQHEVKGPKSFHAARPIQLQHLLVHVVLSQHLHVASSSSLPKSFHTFGDEKLL